MCPSQQLTLGRSAVAAAGLAVLAMILSGCGTSTASQTGDSATSPRPPAIISAEGVARVLIDAGDFPDHIVESTTSPAWSPNDHVTVVSAPDARAEVFASLEAQTGLATAPDVQAWLITMLERRYGGSFAADAPACREFFVAVDEFADVGALFDYDLIATHRTQQVEITLETGQVTSEALRFDHEERATAFVDYLERLSTSCRGTLSGGQVVPFLEYVHVNDPALGARHVSFDFEFGSVSTSTSRSVTRVSFLVDRNVVVRVIEPVGPRTASAPAATIAAERLTAVR